MKMRKMLAVALAMLAVAACDNRKGMQVRTYELHRLTTEEAMSLLTPYISEGGMVSGTSRLLTVRETPAQLDSIARILKRFDGARQALTLHFQVIEAGDFEGTDPTIARVAAPLREMLRYRGYRLVRAVTLNGVEGLPFQQNEQNLRITGKVDQVIPGPEGSITLEVEVAAQGATVSAAVSGAPGQTLVLGSAQRQNGTGALIVAVRPELGSMVAGQAPGAPAVVPAPAPAAPAQP
ncbi:MAG TPA: hypothetical protein VF092_21430 [Longimicrobium sp.]